MFSRPGAALSVAIAALFLTVFVPKAAQAQTCPYTLPDSPADRDVLIVLYCATGGANWTYNTNWLSAEPLGDWYGVAVNSDGRVINVDLEKNNLSGSIPSELGNLTNLEELNLNDNNLSGSIPSELGNLTSLEKLSLGNTHHLTGSNNLTGSIPSELGNLTSLEKLFLRLNNLTGSIPSELGNLTSLEILTLANNNLSGSIPSELGNLTSLESLSFAYNNLSESIPSELGNLTSLEYLSLSNNNLSGSIPSELGSLASLESLWLTKNNLSGSIPSELENLTSLTGLFLRYNNLSGSIPSELGNLTSLESLSLHNNNLSGSIPSELENLTSLEWLWLNHNAELTGELPLGLKDLPINSLNIRCTRITTPSNADFQTWLTGIDFSQGCGTSTPTVTLSLSDASISENGGVTTVTASLDLASSAVTTITVSAAPVSPAAAADYSLSTNKVLTIAAGAMSSTGTVTITAVDNDVYAADKTVTVKGAVANSAGVTSPSDVTLTLEEDDMQVGLATDDETIPETLRLSHYPNPGQGIVTVDYALPEGGAVRLAVIDLLGREALSLVDRAQPAGFHTSRFAPSQLPQGVYLLILQIDNTRVARSMTIVR